MIGIQLPDLNAHASVKWNMMRDASVHFVEFLDDVLVGSLDLQLVGFGISLDRDRCHNRGDLREILLPEVNTIHMASVGHTRNQQADHWHRQRRLDTESVVTGGIGRHALTSARL